MRAFILAGGFATRLWPLTERRAKPLLPLADKPMITHLVERIPNNIHITVSTNSVFANDFEEWKSHVLGTRSFSKGCSHLKSDISILIEDSGHEDQKLGALGAVAKWIQEENIDEDILLLAGDNYIGFSINDFIKKFSGKPLLATYDIRDLAKAKNFGIVMTDSSPDAISGAYRVTGFQEKPEQPESTLVSTGCYVLPEHTLLTLVEYANENPDNIGGVFEHFLSQNMDITCVPFGEQWFDIGSFHAYINATKALVGNHILEGEGTLMKKVETSGSVVLGSGSIVVRSALKDVVLFENCRIEDCNLENCVIDNNCILRGVDLEGKMIREGARLIR